MDVTIALMQPIHGQGYNSDIPRPDAPVIYIGAFPFLTAQPGRRSIYNTNIANWDGYCIFVPRLHYPRKTGRDLRRQYRTTQALNILRN